ncbi:MULTISPECIES: restriction endonuclease subunit S [unclassified Arthrobacter]|uniref:restriction endonuclease subunit S n=1 Tax=unclassified Arthrobacter TaxID=235627 RepID=UPI0006DC8A95|nr:MULTISPECIES: restriction endonuclease subunit S [unclassified Arthrobacter]MSR97742.1 restriction endonuclease subunit S [Arthrobacter sp. BL-252-APC-1A]
MSLKLYPAYKDSGVKSLGHIPAHWDVVRLSRFVNFGNGSDYKHVMVENGGYPVIGSGGEFRRSSEYLFDGESVLFGRKGTVDKPLYVNGKFWTVDTMYYTRIDTHRLLPKFLYYWATRIPFDFYVTSTALPSMTQTDLGSAKIGVPALHEQEAISNYLDCETDEIDAFISDQEDLIALLEERRTAITAQAVTKGLNSSVPMKDSGVTWIGEVPAHWLLSTLGHHFEVVLGKMLDGAKETPVGARVLPYVRAGNIQDAGLDLSDVNEMAFTSYEAERLNLMAKDLLVVEGGSVGTVHYLDSAMDGWSFQKTVNRVRSLGSADTKYLGYLIRVFRDSGVFEVICNGSTIMHLTAEKLRALLIPVPPIDEQRSIAEFVDHETAEIDAAIADARQAIKLSKERRAAVISAAVTGKIDVRDRMARASTNKVGAESVGVA